MKKTEERKDEYGAKEAVYFYHDNQYHVGVQYHAAVHVVNFFIKQKKELTDKFVLVQPRLYISAADTQQTGQSRELKINYELH
ncbi:hypothetical protein M513_03717 [Trichuris suis]|uniref:Uncharacterized protein n=1 Tax=Trichuris suis TaxID=68888 RepID=A0A085MDT1_9BILA|nr:hypothetical protein M513_03717 [Trichuris suis]